MGSFLSPATAFNDIFYWSKQLASVYSGSEFNICAVMTLVAMSCSFDRLVFCRGRCFGDLRVPSNGSWTIAIRHQCRRQHDDGSSVIVKYVTAEPSVDGNLHKVGAHVLHLTCCVQNLIHASVRCGAHSWHSKTFVQLPKFRRIHACYGNLFASNQPRYHTTEL